MSASYIYFVKPVTADGPIKIGCSKNPALRLRVMSCDSPLPLAIIGVFPGGHDVERQLLRQFDHLHSHGSWFRSEADLLDFIDQAQDAGSLDGLVDWSLTGGGHRSRVNTRITRARYRISYVRAPETAEAAE